MTTLLAAAYMTLPAAWVMGWHLVPTRRKPQPAARRPAPSWSTR